MCLVLYLINLVVALLIILPLNTFLNEKIGHSLSVQNILEGFNFTFTADLLNNYGSGISIIYNQSIIALALFFLLSIFLMGGILNILKKSKGFSITEFWQGCTKYFWRLLRLTIYFVILQGGLFFLFFNLFKFFSGGLSPFLLESENNWTLTFKILAPIYLFFASLLFLIQDVAKIHLVHSDRFFVIVPFFQSFILVFKKLLSSLFLFVLVGLTTAVCWWLYWFFSQKIAANTLPTIALSFFLGQCFLLSRIGMNILGLGAMNHFYKNWLKKS